jgi:hypothetical protein
MVNEKDFKSIYTGSKEKGIVTLTGRQILN